MLVGWGLTALSAQIGHIVPFTNKRPLQQQYWGQSRIYG